jgi:pantoate kinase
MSSPVLKTSCAFAPAHITGFFVIFEDGSTGAGVNLAKGAETSVSVYQTPGDLEVVINGVDTEALVSRRVAAAYEEFIEQRRITVATTTEFPVGYGFGMSGAGSFSLSLALNEALGAGKSYRECMQIAADAEIACGTGLGTVMTQQFSGFLIGAEPYPSRSARQVACSEDVVVCCFLDPIKTSAIIRDRSWKERINAIGLECMVEINRTPTVARFRELSRHFTFATGLASEPVRRIMEEVESASMAMLGQTLYAVVHRSEAPEIELRFRAHTNRTTTTTVGDRAAMVIQGA